MTAPHSPATAHCASYRPDIDGLRAIAVLAVVGFHYFPGALAGGFAGVDVFFVISGFLISSGLLADLEQGRFSIGRFYDRRVRRIFPALLAVLLACLAFGWGWLLEDEFRQLGRHVLGGAAFVANFVLWGESGYFDQAAEAKPLLHLWSLAIEEQFYIAWPLLLAVLWRVRRSVLAGTALLAAASFLHGLWLVQDDPTAAFYSPLSRSWELLLGVLLAGLVRRWPALAGRHANLLAWAGLGLLAAGLFLLDHTLRFPGAWALLPAGGTALLIAAGPGAWINRRLLSARMLVWVGLVSYPLYLWHWPLLSLATTVQGRLDGASRIGLVALSLLLAWLSYRWIEQPLRFRRAPNTALLLVLALAGTALLGYQCSIGNPARWAEQAREKAEFAEHFDNNPPELRYHRRARIAAVYRAQCDFYDSAGSADLPTQELAPECHQRDPRAAGVVMLWGDSHAAHLYHGLQQHLPAGWQVLQVSASACYPALHPPYQADAPYCARSNAFALQTIERQRPEVVIVAQNKDHDPATLDAIGAALLGMGVRSVILAGPVPHWTPALPRLVVRELWERTPERTTRGLDPDVLAIDQALRRHYARPLPGRHFVSLIGYFCNDQGCLTRIGPDRKADISSWDYGHLTPLASAALARDVLVPLVLRSTAASR